MLIKNLDTDPNCLTERPCFNCRTMKDSQTGKIRYIPPSENDTYSIQIAPHTVPAGAIIIINYQTVNKATPAYPDNIKTLSNNGWMLTVQALREDTCIIKFQGNNVLLREVTVFSSLDDYNNFQQYNLLSLKADIMPLINLQVGGVA